MSALRLLDHRPDRAAADVAVLGEVRLAPGRIHEFCGPARHTLAMLTAGAMRGPVFWISPAWQHGRPMGDGMVPFLDPGRVTFLTPLRAEDLLWSMEESLRAGCVPLVVADLPGPPGLTPVRRLTLAAENGGGRTLGLLLTPAGGGAAGVETRWHMTPRHSATERAWQLERRRARMAPPKRWRLVHDGRGFELEAAADQA